MAGTGFKDGECGGEAEAVNCIFRPVKLIELARSTTLQERERERTRLSVFRMRSHVGLHRLFASYEASNPQLKLITIEYGGSSVKPQASADTLRSVHPQTFIDDIKPVPLFLTDLHQPVDMARVAISQHPHARGQQGCRMPFACNSIHSR